MGYDHFRYARKVGSDIIFQDPTRSYPKIVQTDSNLDLYQPSAGSLRLIEDATQYAALYRDGTDNIIRGYIGDNDTYLLTPGAGVVKFGTEIVNAGSDRGKLIKIKTAAGDVVYIKAYDTV